MRPFTILVLLLVLCACPAVSTAWDAIVVVRHAEKADDGSHDPPLNQLGQERAEALAHVLRESDVTGLIASNYRRTRQTLSVLAAERELPVTRLPADAGEIDAHVGAVVAAARERDRDGLLVIAGHSNTVPLIVRELSGRNTPEMDESEYDRLVLLLPAESGMNVIETRYGAASEQNRD